MKNQYQKQNIQKHESDSKIQLNSQKMSTSQKQELGSSYPKTEFPEAKPGSRRWSLALNRQETLVLGLSIV